MASGGCLCGAVRYEVDGPLRDVWNCHCERCRRWTGHHLAASAAAASDVTVGDPSAVRWYAAAPGVHYGSCATCGSSLFWKVDAEPGHLSIAAGTLDQPTGLATTTAWWVSEAADYHRRADGLVEHDLEG
ncbi:GFA family protein [Nocardioides oleivorans]|uniref:GFA family protein n=1 Tax=Nocardioides oleivorans TaxID=273676 RepID=A0A4Q2RXU4_9ACTN|nr:GFA family protein [Nocardioides oleivorans]RYB93606.1 GFA family protein [Nocardioides oleivorans]